jgi:hypothetical protein
MTGTTQRTTDHETIHEWAEERGMRPFAVKDRGVGHEISGLRLDPPDAGSWMEEITWDDFFRRFEEMGLEFLYQDKTREGEPSTFYRLINRSGQTQTRPERPRAAETRGERPARGRRGSRVAA